MFFSQMSFFQQKQVFLRRLKFGKEFEQSNNSVRFNFMKFYWTTLKHCFPHFHVWAEHSNNGWNNSRNENNLGLKIKSEIKPTRLEQNFIVLIMYIIGHISTNVAR